jgi:hypothetical protein
MKTLKRILFFIAGICLLVACSKSDLFSGDDFNVVNLNEMNLKSLVVHEGTIPLEGFTRFDVYAKMEHKVIVDGQLMYLICTAELIFSDKQHFVLNTKEYMPLPEGPALYREISFSGKMSPGGALKFSWPETWWELGEWRGNVLGQIRDHTGYNVSGPGINNNTVNYTGYFDGNRFFADIHLNALQEVPGSMPPYDVVVDGPILVNFSIDLEVSE